MRLQEHEVVARIERLQLRELRVWVREGWVRPAAAPDGPVFDALDLARIQLICELRKDMALPVDALPVVLSLLDQVHGLRRELRKLAAAVDRQPAQARAAIAETLAALSGDRR